jgi:hypothetical protein
LGVLFVFSALPFSTERISRFGVDVVASQPHPPQIWEFSRQRRESHLFYFQHPKAKECGAMKLDTFLPEYEFNEVHKIRVNAPAGQVFAAIKELTAAELSPLVFAMLNLRSLPARLMGKAEPENRRPGPFLDSLYEGGFIRLAEAAEQEIVFGLIGQFWKLAPTPGPEIATPQAFLAYSDPNFAKVAANLMITPNADGSVLCSTETRVDVPDTNTRRKFAFYWMLICMGSGWIRILWLRAIKRRAERISS